MNLYVDLATRRIVFSPKLNKEIARVDVKRGDVFPLSIVFLSNGKQVQINATPQIVFCAKSKNNLEGAALVLANAFTLVNATTKPSYDGTVSFNSAELAVLLNNAEDEADDFTFVDLYSEISWMDATKVYTTSNLLLRVYNDVYKGGEANPTPQPNEPAIFVYGIETPTIEGIDGGPVTVNGTLNANHIHGNIAGTLYTHVRTGEAMSKGDPFYISGYHNGDGGYPIARKAKASDPTKMPAIGVMDASYAANVNGANGIISGTISGINTSGFVVNKPVYVGGDGGYSNVAGDIAQQIGITERANNSTGAFIVSNAKRDPIERFVVLTEADLVTIDGSQVFNLTTQGVYSILSLPEEAWSGIVVIPNADSGQYVIINQSGYDGEIHAGIGNSIADLFTGKRVTLFFDYGGDLAWNVSESTGSAVGIREAKTNNQNGTPDSLNDGTVTGVTIFDDGLFTYNGGAAEAHRTALELTTLATTTPGTNVANFLEFPTSDNLASALTDENGTGGGFVRAEGASLTTPTLVGTPVFNATSYTYGTGAAEAHKTALGLNSAASLTNTDLERSINANSLNFMPPVTFFDDMDGKMAWIANNLGAGGTGPTDFDSYGLRTHGVYGLRTVATAAAGRFMFARIRTSAGSVAGARFRSCFAISDVTNCNFFLGFSWVGVGNVGLLYRSAFNSGQFTFVRAMNIDYTGGTVYSFTTEVPQAGDFTLGKRYIVDLTMETLTSCRIKLYIADFNLSNWTEISNAVVTLPSTSVNVAPTFSVQTLAAEIKTLWVDWVSVEQPNFIR